MIQKVSNQEKVSWIEGDKSFERDSMNKTALDSFSLIVAQDAKKMIANGETESSVAQKYKLPVEVIKNLMAQLEDNKEVKLACACENSQTDTETYDQYLAKAEAARNSLYTGNKKDNIDGLETYSSKRILTNKGNYISDVGGSSNQIKSQNSNSIFEPNRLDDLTKVRDNGERIRAENELLAKQREEMKKISRYETIDLDKLSESIENNELNRPGVVRSTANSDTSVGYSKRVQSNGISIFDEKAFDKIPEQTSGEARRKELADAAKAPKDRSWVEAGAKAVNSNDFVDRMIANLTANDPKLKEILKSQE